MQSTLETERLILSRLTVNDADFIITLVNSEGWLKFIGDRNIHNSTDALAYINKIMNNPDMFYWVAQLKSNNQSIGVITYLKRNYLEHFDIGFAFLPGLHGNGYAFEAANKVLSMITVEEQHQHIQAITIPENISSIKLLTKLGFRFEEEREIEGERLFVYGKKS